MEQNKIQQVHFEGEVCRDKIIDGIASKISSDVPHYDDQFNRINANTQQILTPMRYVMTQMYELQEYTISRLDTFYSPI
jgi:hypothetical protein